MSILEGIDHIDIVVSDPEAMARFFIAAGFSEHRRTNHGGGSVELRFPGPGEQPILELTSPIDGNGKSRPLGLRHMALRSGDIGAAMEAFVAAGLPVKGGMRAIPETGRTLFNLIDPEGGTLQIVDGA